MTREEWQDECDYIRQVAAKYGEVPEMNGCCSTFLKYCRMQRDIAKEQGFPAYAQCIQSYVDVLSSPGRTRE